MTHYIEEGGAFSRACAELVSSGFNPLYIELWTEGDAAKARKTAASKTKYTCPSCQVNAWAKPGVRLVCGECREAVEAEEAG